MSDLAQRLMTYAAACMADGRESTRHIARLARDGSNEIERSHRELDQKAAYIYEQEKRIAKLEAVIDALKEAQIIFTGTRSDKLNAALEALKDNNV